MSRHTPSRETLLERSVLRVANDETFLASDLRVWAGGTLDLDALATFLGCTREGVVKVSLCRRPDPAAASFRPDILKIAVHAGVDEQRLLELVREAASLAAFRKSDGTQLLAAARDDRTNDDKDES